MDWPAAVVWIVLIGGALGTICWMRLCDHREKMNDKE